MFARQKLLPAFRSMNAPAPVAVDPRDTLAQALAKPSLMADVVDLAPHPLFVKSSRHHWVLVNQAFCALTDRPSADFIGRPNQDVFLPSIADALDHLEEDAFATSQPIDHELILPGPSGTRLTVIVKMTRSSDIDAQPILIGAISDITKFKQVETELTDLYENAPCGDHSLDRDGLILRMNQTELRWLGYERSEVVGKLRVQDLLTPAALAAFAQDFAAFKQSGTARNIEREFRRKDGSTLSVLVSADIVHDSGGNFFASRTPLIDNSADKLAKAAIAESELRFRQAFETAAHGMALVSVEGNFIKVNSALCSLLGYDEHELVATDFQTITHRDDLASDLGHVEDLLAGSVAAIIPTADIGASQLLAVADDALYVAKAQGRNRVAWAA